MEKDLMQDSSDVLALSCLMESANTGRVRLVRCPKCYNVLPEPPNVSLYKCGGCNTTLKAKIRVINGENVVTKQVRQSSESYSVVTSVSNEASPRNKEPGLTGVTVNSSGTPDAPSTEIEHERGVTRSIENGDATSDEHKVAEVTNTENKEDWDFDGQDTNGKMEAPTELIHSDTNVKHVDSGKEENNTVKPSPENSEACKIREEGNMKFNQNNSEHKMPVPAGRNSAESFPDSEQNAAFEAEPDASKSSKLVRVQSRSCDLREGPRSSSNSLDFFSPYTSFRSKSFRASEPLESKIMKTVDDLRGDLYDIFSKPSDCKAMSLPPRPWKQGGYMPHAAITSSLPLTAYHPAVNHSGHASRLSRSGQVAPHELPPVPRYRRRRRGAHSYCHSGQMETRPCSHECCHGCSRLPCCSSWKQEPALQKPPPGKEMKRRPAGPRNLCRPVLRGAPFVLCSNCLKLVQLPTEFAVPSRRTRRLQCGSCSEILSYSYRDPSRKKLESPFGGDEHSTDDHHHNTGAAHQADHYSYSEDYGLSAGASYSTEDEQPLHVSRNSSFNTSHGSSAKGSKLHRLMGYTSASELLRHQHSPDLYESFSRRTPAARTRDDPKGKGIRVTDNHDSGREEERSAVRKSKARSGGLLFHGMLKRGIHGLESLKLRS